MFFFFSITQNRNGAKAQVSEFRHLLHGVVQATEDPSAAADMRDVALHPRLFHRSREDRRVAANSQESANGQVP